MVRVGQPNLLSDAHAARAGDGLKQVAHGMTVELLIDGRVEPRAKQAVGLLGRRAIQEGRHKVRRQVMALPLHVGQLLLLQAQALPLHLGRALLLLLQLLIEPQLGAVLVALDGVVPVAPLIWIKGLLDWPAWPCMEIGKSYRVKKHRDHATSCKHYVGQCSNAPRFNIPLVLQSREEVQLDAKCFDGRSRALESLEVLIIQLLPDTAGRE